MRKVVFEGNINGKKFDSVQDYNAEMQRLMTSGAMNIQASSSTRVVDDLINQEKPKDDAANAMIPGRPAEAFFPDDYLPLFSEEAKVHYLDLLTTTDEAKNLNNFNLVDKSLTVTLNKLKTAINNGDVDLDDAINYMRLVKDVREKLDNDTKINIATENELKARIAECNKRIKEDTEKLKVTNNAKPFIKIVSDFYNQAYDAMKSYVLNV